MNLRLVNLIATTDLVDWVYKAVVDAISTGALPLGARVTQEDLAEQLAVSRLPVLQALWPLKIRRSAVRSSMRRTVTS